MKSLRKVLYIFLLLGMLACNNKVDINSEYQDISIVYGLLNQSQSRQFVKITKAFQTEGNVHNATKDSSLSQYQIGDLEVYIDEYGNGNFMRTIDLDTFLVTDKDSGEFYYPNQIVYATPPNTHLDENHEYKLVVNIKSLDKTLKASTELIHDFSILKPNSGQKYVSFASRLPQTVEWRSAVNGKLYQLIIRFFYTEKDASGNLSSHHIDIPLNTKVSQTTQGGEKLKDEFYGDIFYQTVAAKVPQPEAGMVRYADSVFYIFSVADENFYIYMDLNKPSSSVVQERPSYSNIENGVGIFAGRYNKMRKFLGLATRSLDTLIDGQYTRNLGFDRYPIP